MLGGLVRAFSALALLLLLESGVLPGPAQADDNSAPDNVSTSVLSQAAQSKLGFGRGSIIVAPIPIKDPTLGTGLVLTGGYLFKLDAKSDTSFIGLAGARTDNGSYAAGAAANIFFGDGRWGILTAFGKADVNYDLYGVGLLSNFKLPISQDGSFARVKLVYGVTDNLKVALQATYLESTIRFNGTPPAILPPALSGLALKASQVQVGPIVMWDTQDDSIYPTRGVYGSLSYQQGQGLGRFKRDFSQSVAFGRSYLSFGSTNVLAAKLTACSTSQQAPFYNLCGVGSTDGFRGFPTGQYLGATLLSAQVELRHRFSPRWGGVVFGGVAEVGRRFDFMGTAGPIYAGGLGVRFRLSRKFPLDFRVDESFNDAGQNYTYIGIGQAF